MYINLVNLDLCPGQGGSSKPEEHLIETITTNGSHTYSPTPGSVFSDAEISVAVPMKVEETFTVNPSTQAQTVTPQSGHVFSSGTVAAVDSTIDQNIVPGNIRTGVSILGVTGNVSPAKSEETFTVNPSTQAQTVTPQSGHVFSGGTVAAVDSTIDANITPSNIKDGVEILGVLGTYTGGSGKDYRNQTGTVTGLADLGWDADSIGYYQANNPHYSWQNSEYAVKQANIDLYGVVNKNNKGNYSSNTDMEYLPMFDTTGVTSMGFYFNSFGNIKGIPILDTSSVTSMYGMFNSCSSLITIPLLNTSSVTNMSFMFSSCSSLTTVPLLDTGSVTDMQSMFSNCTSLTTIPLLDTSSVTSMRQMFFGSRNLTTIPLLDTSSVTNMDQMFYECYALTTIPALNTSSVTNMGYMFGSCHSLTTIPALDTSSVTNMIDMFYNCYALKTVNGIDFSSMTAAPSGFLTNIGSSITRFIVNGKIDFTWNGSNGLDNLTQIDFDSVKSILQAMSGTTNTDTKTMKLDRVIEDQNGELAALVADCQTKGWTITGLTITRPKTLQDIGWDAQSISYYGNQTVTSANAALYGVLNKDNKGDYKNNTDMEYLPMFDTTGETDMHNYFDGFSHIKGLPILDTSSVTNMYMMFLGCTSLTTVPLLDTGSVTDMSFMFSSCSSLTTVPLLDTGSVTDMSNMFEGCTSLTSVPLLDTSAVEYMSYMFHNCTSLTTIPALDTSSVTTTESMFEGCTSLTTVDGLDTSSVTSMDNMFHNCTSLTTVDGIDFSSMTAAPSYFLQNAGSTVTHFIVNGKIDFTWNGTDGLNNLTAIDFESVKSILQAMSRTTDTNAKTMKLSRTIRDQNGQLAALKTQCESKGWTITGLTITSGGLVVDDDPEIIVGGDENTGDDPLYSGELCYIGDQVTFGGIQMNELRLNDGGTLVGYGYYDEDELLSHYYDTDGNEINNMDDYAGDFDLYLIENGLV